jgi:hypothetical protein
MKKLLVLAMVLGFSVAAVSAVGCGGTPVPTGPKATK